MDNCDFHLGDKLASIYGGLKAQQLLADKLVVKIDKDLGRVAVLLWLLVTEREWVARYGGRGLHILTPLELSKASGLPLLKVEHTLVPLLCKGYLRMSGEAAVRAA